MKNTSFYIISDKNITKKLSENSFFELVPPFFLLVKKGIIKLQNKEECLIKNNTIAVSAKQDTIKIESLSADCECILLQYDRKYIRTMSLQLNLLDAFKYVYANSKLTFNLLEKDFNDLWFLANYINNQLKKSQKLELEKYILRHLNYSFLYSTIEKMDRNNKFESNPTTQQEKLVYQFFVNLHNNGTSKLNVADYAEKQHITARHLSATVKQVTGMSALDIIHRLLLRRAKNALTTTDKPISEIALELGYPDPYTFSHFFKKQSGLNPTDFRNNYQG